jgi:hypothetical protein
MGLQTCSLGYVEENHGAAARITLMLLQATSCLICKDRIPSQAAFFHFSRNRENLSFGELEASDEPGR